MKTVSLVTSLFLLVFVLPVSAQTPVIAEGSSFSCTPIYVWDGDGPIWCKEGPRVRLAGIATRELDDKCKRHHPCPRLRGVDARDRLVDLIGTRIGEKQLSPGKQKHVVVAGLQMRCVSAGRAIGKRTAAWCFSPKSGDINCAMVANGWALRWDKFWKDHQC